MRTVRTIGILAATHPLLASRPAQKVELILVTSDRGLAGAFNSNVLRRAQRFMTENGDRYSEIQISTMGRKARDSFRARKTPVRKDYPGIHQKLSFERAAEMIGAAGHPVGEGSGVGDVESGAEHMGTAGCQLLLGARHCVGVTRAEGD